MLKFINILLCLALSLVAFVVGENNTATGVPWDHYVWQNNGKALSETW